MIKRCRWRLFEVKKCLAEREGFEPPVPFRVHRFSRPTVSTAHTPLRVRLLTVYQHWKIGALDQSRLAKIFAIDVATFIASANGRIISQERKIFLYES